MKVVVAPDTLTGTLTAAEAANAIATGWSSVRPDDEVVVVPMADGGDGTIEVVAAAVAGARQRETEVLDARGRPTIATWLALPDGRALVESAQACGLSRLAADDRDPATATSFGVGQLLLAARAAGHGTVIVGLGGSATVDGGAGAVRALGHRLTDLDGELDHAGRGTPLGASVVIAADVRSTLLGPEGAVARFAPQKGATPAQIPLLEHLLERLADIVERDLDGGPWRDRAGAGAAGGLGFGLAAFCDARIVPGAEVIAELVGLPAALEGAAVVVTGEGALDRQTATGKVPAHVLRLARSRKVQAFAIAGRLEDGAGDVFDAVAELGAEGLHRPAELLAFHAGRLASTIV